MSRDPIRRRASGEIAAAHNGSETRLRVARELPVSGSHALPHTRLRQILLAYLSPILVDSVLDKALRDKQLTRASLGSADLSNLAADAMVGLRLFVAGERLPMLMLELADFLDKEAP